jgi:hypothetical protein
LEDLVAHIDTPVLSRLYMSFFRDAVFDIPHVRAVHRSCKRAQTVRGSQGGV